MASLPDPTAGKGKPCVVVYKKSHTLPGCAVAYPTTLFSADDLRVGNTRIK